jgi:hypothetical protein
MHGPYNLIKIYKKICIESYQFLVYEIDFYVVLYVRETWEEHRRSMVGNSVLRRIFGPKWNDETRGCRELHNEKFHTLYSSAYVIRIIKSRRMTCEEGTAYKTGCSREVTL